MEEWIMLDVTIREKLCDEIRAYNALLLDKFPIEKYLELLDCYPGTVSYHHVSPEVKTYTENIIQNSCKSILEVYHQPSYDSSPDVPEASEELKNFIVKTYGP